MLEPASAMEELPASGAETGTDGIGRGVATTLVLVTEEDAEDTLIAENAASIPLLVCLDAIENARKTTRANERIKPEQTAAQMHKTSSKLHDLRASTRPLMLSEDPYVGYGRMTRERR